MLKALWAKLRGLAQDKLPLSHSLGLDEPGLCAIVGDVGTGKSMVLGQLIAQATGPVIVISRVRQPLLGAEDAPFQGEFCDAQGIESSMDLAEMLEQRPTGVFVLSVPSTWVAGTPQGRTFQSRLTQMLADPAGGGRCEASVFMEDAERLLGADYLKLLAASVRRGALKVTVTLQNAAVADHCLDNLTQLVALGPGAVSHCARLAKLLGAQHDELAYVPPGWATVWRARTPAATKLAKAF